MSKIYHLGARAAAAALVVCMVTGCTAAPPADRTPANETGAMPAASNSQASNSNAASSEKSALSQPASQRSSSDTKISSTHDALSTNGNDESRTDGETSGESTSAAEKQAQNANVLTLKSEPSPAEQANAKPVEALPNGKAVYTDSSGNPLAGEWRYEGADCVFDAEGHLVASGQALGTKGRLCIPSAGVDVAVNWSDSSNAQYHTDLEDSAAYVRYDQGRYYIADHNTQEFAGLTSACVGDVAYLFTDAGIEAFACTNTFVGHNTGDMLTDGDGNELAPYMPECGFTAYTCLDSWTNIQVTLWQRTWIASTSSSAATVQLERSDAQTQPMESNNAQNAQSAQSGQGTDKRGIIVSINHEHGANVFEHVADNGAPAEAPLVNETPQGEESLGGMQPNSVWTDNAGEPAQPQVETYPETHLSADSGGPEFGAQGGMDR